MKELYIKLQMGSVIHMCPVVALCYHGFGQEIGTPYGSDNINFQTFNGIALNSSGMEVSFSGKWVWRGIDDKFPAHTTVEERINLNSNWYGQLDIRSRVAIYERGKKREFGLILDKNEIGRSYANGDFSNENWKSGQGHLGVYWMDSDLQVWINAAENFYRPILPGDVYKARLFFNEMWEKIKAFDFDPAEPEIGEQNTTEVHMSIIDRLCAEEEE